MIRTCLPLLGFLLLLASCDKQRDSGSNRGVDANPPLRETKRERPTRENGEEEPAVDPREALQQADATTAGDGREKALSMVAWDTLETDPEISAQAFAKLAVDSPERIRLIEHASMRRAEENPDEALKWADSLGSEKEISVAKCRIALALAENDPLRAAAMLSESGIEGREFDVALVQVVQRWAQKSPADAAAWVVGFKTSEARTASVREIVDRWIKKDSQAVFAWKAGLTDPALRQEVVSALVEAASNQPEGSTPTWLEAADEETRQAIRDARH